MRIVRKIVSYRTIAQGAWLCVLALVCSQVGLFPLPAAAQEPTTEPTALPTPTPAPTWTSVPTPTNTPDPAATPTANHTANARMVDFRVDSDEITKGDCVTFSWVVRGDIDRVEFDQIGDGKVPVLVSDMDSRQECPEEETEYQLVVSWLDSTRTTRSIEVEVNDAGGDGENATGSGTPTPGGTGAFVPVTPILITSTPVSVGGNANPQATAQNVSGGVVVTPVGVLGSVQVLPETGHLSSSPHQSTDQVEDGLSSRESRLAFGGWLVLFLFGLVTGAVLATRGILKSEVFR